jgi:quinolinate synthase
MKMTTPERLLTSLREGTFEVTVEEDIRQRALASVERMIAIGSSSPRGE